MVRLTEWIWKLIPKTRWCISKWAICDFQGGDGWRARKSDYKWGAGTARRLKRDKVVKVAWLSSCKNFLSEWMRLESRMEAWFSTFSANYCDWISISCSETWWTYWLFCTLPYFTVKTKMYNVIISHMFSNNCSLKILSLFVWILLLSSTTSLQFLDVYFMSHPV